MDIEERKELAGLIDGIVDRIEQGSLDELLHPELSDPEAIKVSQRELAKARRALLKARQALSGEGE